MDKVELFKSSIVDIGNNSIEKEVKVNETFLAGIQVVQCCYAINIGHIFLHSGQQIGRGRKIYWWNSPFVLAKFQNMLMVGQVVGNMRVILNVFDGTCLDGGHGVKESVRDSRTSVDFTTNSERVNLAGGRLSTRF